MFRLEGGKSGNVGSIPTVSVFYGNLASRLRECRMWISGVRVVIWMWYYRRNLEASQLQKWSVMGRKVGLSGF